MDLNVTPKGILLMLIVGLPLMSLMLVWLLGIAESYLRQQFAFVRLLSVLLVLALATTAVAVGAWAVFYAKITYGWFAQEWYLALVIPWAIMLFISFIMGEKRKTLWDFSATCLDCLAECCDECC